MKGKSKTLVTQSETLSNQTEGLSNQTKTICTYKRINGIEEIAFIKGGNMYGVRRPSAFVHSNQWMHYSLLRFHIPRILKLLKSKLKLKERKKQKSEVIKWSVQSKS